MEYTKQVTQNAIGDHLRIDAQPTPEPPLSLYTGHDVI